MYTIINGRIVAFTLIDGKRVLPKGYEQVFKEAK